MEITPNSKSSILISMTILTDILSLNDELDAYVPENVLKEDFIWLKLGKLKNILVEITPNSKSSILISMTILTDVLKLERRTRCIRIRECFKRKLSFS
ncbi:uncharacterized protein [Palaemon carinicauda]|uniref:uncharacterized protein isoform X2 n=1 Tax=Palaemon carinicauda TaxID=392227 RepID=UPI0035B680F0